MAKKELKNNHFIKDLNEIGKQSKNFAKDAQEMTTNLVKLPWKKLPLIGWFYIIFILLIMIVVAIFIVPHVSLI